MSPPIAAGSSPSPDIDRLIADFGQLFVLAFDGARLPPDVAEFFRAFHIGGVILFGDNYHDPAQLRELTADIEHQCARPAQPLFIATDHEGGRVQRFREGFTGLEPAAVYGRGDPQRTRVMYRRAARELRAAGINVNLAPVADLCPADRPGAIGDRAFGGDPLTVARHVGAAVRGIEEAGLLACVKHFPGHGATEQDSHRVLPSVSHDQAHLEAYDLVPFRAAVSAGVSAVMPGHVLYPRAGDARWPASVSSFWLSEVLRGQLRFQGLVVTDALEMRALRDQGSPEDCGLLALEAGADLLIYYKEAHQYRAVFELRSALARGDVNPARVRESLARIERHKRRFIPGQGR